MVRRSALPEAVASVAMPGQVTAPPRDGDYGWNQMRRQWAHFPEMYDCLRRDAELARAIAITHPSHPAYPDLDQQFADNGKRLAELRRRHREMIAAKKS